MKFNKGESKYTLEDIRAIAVKQECKLISKEFVDTRSFIEYLCPKNHKCKSRISKFITKFACKKCQYLAKQHSQEYIFNYIKSFGYKVISKEYKGTNEELTLICPAGHTIKRTWNHFLGARRNGIIRCRYCSGYRRSKLEIWIENKLKQSYPNLEIMFNNRTTIGLELDIYIPSLNLAFELNGIFHYEPIYGQEKLDYIKSNDKKKLKRCLKNNIKLFVIDVSKQKKYKDEDLKPYLDTISNLINLI